MSLASIKDHLQRQLDTLDFDEGPSCMQVTDTRSNCSVAIRMESRRMCVLMLKEDAIPFSTERVAAPRMAAGSSPMSLRIRKPDGGWELFSVTKAGRDRGGQKVVAYRAAENDGELLKVVRLIVAVLNKAAEIYVAA